MTELKKILAEYLIKFLKLVNDSTADSMAGFLAVTKVSLTLTPLFLIWDKLTNWGIHNQDYILIVLGAIFVDWVFGTIKHIWFTHTFTWKQNAIGLTTKIALAVAGGFLFEGLNTLVKDVDIVVTSFKIITRVIILMYPGVSAFENIYIVSGEKFPPKAWMERLKVWNKSLDPNDLINNKNNGNTNENS
ncbi:MAG: hypothetical protein WBA59_03985 [Moheibacter sp.]